MYDYNDAKNFSASAAQSALVGQAPMPQLSAISDRLSAILKRTDETSNVLRGNMDRILGGQPEAVGGDDPDRIEVGALGGIRVLLDRIEVTLDTIEAQSRRLHAL